MNPWTMERKKNRETKQNQTKFIHLGYLQYKLPLSKNGLTEQTSVLSYIHNNIAAFDSSITFKWHKKVGKQRKVNRQTTYNSPGKTLVPEGSTLFQTEQHPSDRCTKSSSNSRSCSSRDKVSLLLICAEVLEHLQCIKSITFLTAGLLKPMCYWAGKKSHASLPFPPFTHTYIPKSTNTQCPVKATFFKISWYPHWRTLRQHQPLFPSPLCVHLCAL